jgi:hypothetical protein
VGEYDLPDDSYLDNRISNAWFSITGSARERKLLKAGSLRERSFTEVGVPSIYIRSGGKIILSPVPQTTIANGLFINYVRTLNKLDTRRGEIETVTTLDNTITSLKLNINTTFEPSFILDDCFLSVVDKCGDVKMRRVPVADINQSTGDITLEPGFEFEDGESISAGDYVVSGKFATNRSELPDMCERYLLQYCNWKILKRDSSNDSMEQTEELVNMRAEIVETFKQVDDDNKTITIDDTTFIDEDDLFIF